MSTSGRSGSRWRPAVPTEAPGEVVGLSRANLSRQTTPETPISSTVTPDQLRALTHSAGGKYHSRRTYVAELNRTFHSQREADAAVTLWRRQQAGEVRNLQFQAPFPLRVNGELICTYYADFVYSEKRQTDPSTPEFAHLWYWSLPVIADAKSPPTRTAVYKLKKRLMAVCLGLEIVEL